MYAVSGITGHTGRIVARILKSTGHQVRALVRNPDHVPELEKQGYETRVVDLADAQGLALALKGTQGAYLLVPPHFGPGILEHQSAIAASIGKALTEVKLKRVVLLSSIGAEHDKGTGPILAAHRLEQACVDVPGVTFLRAAYFLENWLHMATPVRQNGVLPNFLPAQIPFPMVATEDIGRTAASLLLQEEAPRDIVQLAGPADLTPEEVAQTFSLLMKAKIQLLSPPLSQLVDSFVESGAPRELAELFLEMYQAASDGRLRFESGPVRRGSLPVKSILGEGMQLEGGSTPQVCKAVDTYFQASYLGDADALKEVFAKEAIILPAQAAPMDRDTFIQRVVSGRKAGTTPNYAFEKQILSLDASETSALVTARVRVGEQVFTDHLSLERSDRGEFLIQRKAYAPAPSLP